ncbi:MFS transporter [Celerinatantimonas sp. YJH-8]|uniref:MFS transporter n=1 Tax=Celerinatantimonas sp. YJH-8 TaxID=3228714 RepID=UPI0038CBDFBA
MQRLYQLVYQKVFGVSGGVSGLPENAPSHAVPGNFFKIVLAQFLSKCGDELINPKITLPWVMQSLGIPASFLGWLVPIRESGSMLPQIVIAAGVRRLAIRKFVWVGGSLLMSLSVLAIVLTMTQFRAETAGWLILLCLIVFSLSRGLNSVAFKDVLGKTIPKQQRGRVSGWATAGAGGVTLLIAWLLARHLESQQMLIYTSGFILAACCWIVGAMVYSQVCEQPGEVEYRSVAPIWHKLVLLKNDKPFRLFVIARALMLCSALSAPYYVALAQQQNAASGLLQFSFFLGASGAAAFISGPFWGKLADHSSRQVMILASLMSAILGSIVVFLAWFVPGILNWQWVIPACYFLLTIAHQGVRLGRKTYLVDLAQGNQRTDYVSVSNTVIGAILLVTGVISFAEPWLGIAGVLAILVVMGALGAILAAKLPEVE